MLISQGGVFFNRDINKVYDIPNKKARNMIEKKVCVEYHEEKHAEISFKRNLKNVNEELESAFKDNGKLKLKIEELESKISDQDNKSYERKIKSLSDELKKTKTTLKRTETYLNKEREKNKNSGKKKSENS